MDILTVRNQLALTSWYFDDLRLIVGAFLNDHITEEELARRGKEQLARMIFALNQALSALEPHKSIEELDDATAE